MTHSAVDLGEDRHSQQSSNSVEPHTKQHDSCGVSSWGSLSVGTHDLITSSGRLAGEDFIPARSASSLMADEAALPHAEGCLTPSDGKSPGVTLSSLIPCADATVACRPPGWLPSLDLSRVKGCASSPLPTALTQQEAKEAAPQDAALCFDASANRSVRADAPAVDCCCHVYPPTTMQEAAAAAALLARLPPRDAGPVAELWDALLRARRDCETMAARGVRVARDVSRDWQQTVSDLIDRVVAQDAEIGTLRRQQASAAPPSEHGAREELAAQVVRLKRQRDKLSQERREAAVALHEAHEMLDAARAEVAQTQDALGCVRSLARRLHQQQVALLRRHMEVAAHADALEGEVARLTAAAVLAASPKPTPMGVLGGVLLDAAGVGGAGGVLGRRASPRAVARSLAGSPASMGHGGSRLCGTPKGDGARGGTAASSVTPGRLEPHDGYDSEDQFDRLDQQSLLSSLPAPVLLQLPSVKQQWARGGGGDAAATALLGGACVDYRTDMEACRQQLEALAALAL